jgi:hypothetical protein
MSEDIIQRLVDQLEHEKPRKRIQAIRWLAEIGNPSVITPINSIYQDEHEKPEVRRAAGDALGVFKAIKECLDQGIDFELPEPSEVKAPRWTPELLRRLLVVLGVVIDVALLVIPVTRPADPSQMFALLQARSTQARADVGKQQTAWQTYQTSGQMDCSPELDPARESVDASALRGLTIDPAAEPALNQANLALIAAIDQLTLVSNNRVVVCSTGTLPGTIDENLQRLTQAAAVLDQGDQFLGQAQATLVAPTAPAATEPVKPTALPETPTSEAPPTEVPTATPAVDLAYYIRELRQRLEFVTGARGEATLLAQYWADIQTAGQSAGCRQAMDPAAPILADYAGLRPADSAADPRLDNLVTTYNLGVALTRDSMRNFMQGCNSNNFGPVFTVGQQQALQGISALNQVSALLDQLEAEVAP